MGKERRLSRVSAANGHRHTPAALEISIESHSDQLRLTRLNSMAATETSSGQSVWLATKSQRETSTSVVSSCVTLRGWKNPPQLPLSEMLIT